MRRRAGGRPALANHSAASGTIRSKIGRMKSSGANSSNGRRSSLANVSRICIGIAAVRAHVQSYRFHGARPLVAVLHRCGRGPQSRLRLRASGETVVADICRRTSYRIAPAWPTRAQATQRWSSSLSIVAFACARAPPRRKEKQGGAGRQRVAANPPARARHGQGANLRAFRRASWTRRKPYIITRHIARLEARQAPAFDGCRNGTSEDLLHRSVAVLPPPPWRRQRDAAARSRRTICA